MYSPVCFLTYNHFITTIGSAQQSLYKYEYLQRLVIIFMYMNIPIDTSIRPGAWRDREAYSKHR